MEYYEMINPNTALKCGICKQITKLKYKMVNNNAVYIATAFCKKCGQCIDAVLRKDDYGHEK